MKLAHAMRSAYVAPPRLRSSQEDTLSFLFYVQAALDRRGKLAAATFLERKIVPLLERRATRHRRSPTVV